MRFHVVVLSMNPQFLEIPKFDSRARLDASVGRIAAPLEFRACRHCDTLLYIWMECSNTHVHGSRQDEGFEMSQPVLPRKLQSELQVASIWRAMAVHAKRCCWVHATNISFPLRVMKPQPVEKSCYFSGQHKWVSKTTFYFKRKTALMTSLT